MSWWASRRAARRSRRGGAQIGAEGSAHAEGRSGGRGGRGRGARSRSRSRSWRAGLGGAVEVGVGVATRGRGPTARHHCEPRTPGRASRFIARPRVHELDPCRAAACARNACRPMTPSYQDRRRPRGGRARARRRPRARGAPSQGPALQGQLDRARRGPHGAKRGGRWKRWGYDSLEAYAKTELHLRPETVDKLTGSYTFLQRKAPPCSRATP